MNFKVIGHPKAITVTDDILRYLVVLYEHGEVDVFRSEIGGVFIDPRCFFNFTHFEQGMRHVSEAVKEDLKKQDGEV